MMATKEQKAKSEQRMAESAGLAGGDKPPPEPAAKKAPDPQFDGVGGLKAAKTIRLDRLVPDPDQPRKEFDEEKLAHLVASLKDEGQIQPIRVRYDEVARVYVVISGGRRLEAARRAGLPSLECIVDNRMMTRSARLVLQAVENGVRDDLTDIEWANAISELMGEEKLTQSEAAARFKLDRSKVARLLALLALPVKVQEMVHEGDLPASTAWKLNDLESDADKEEMATRIVTEEMNRDTAKREIDVLAAKRAEEAEAREATAIEEDDRIIREASEDAEGFAPGEETPATGSRPGAVVVAKEAKAEAKKAKPDGRKKARTIWHEAIQGMKVTVERKKGLSLTEAQTALELALSMVRNQIAAEASGEAPPKPATKKAKAEA